MARTNLGPGFLPVIDTGPAAGSLEEFLAAMDAAGIVPPPPTTKPAGSVKSMTEIQVVKQGQVEE